MANDQPVIISGKLTEDPQLRFTPSGAAVANFTIAFNPRRFDRNTNEWVSGEAIFWRCEAWNQGKLTRAENICNLLKKADSVIAQGVIETKKWTTKDGENRSALQVNVHAIGKDLTFHGQAYQSNEAQGGQDWAGNQPPAQDDPWATPAATTVSGSWPVQEPPF